MARRRGTWTRWAALLALCVPVAALGGEGGGERADGALARLTQGNARFAVDEPLPLDLSAARRQALAKGQTPHAVVLACADSRVAPEHVFGAGLGELFVIRVAGNVADPVVLGSIEYAVEHLHVPLIVVLGHSGCGAVTAALGETLPEGNLGTLVRAVRTGECPSREPGARLDAAVRHNARFQATVLTKSSPPIKHAVEAGEVRIVTAVYDLGSGKVEWLPAPAPAAVVR